MTTLAQAVAPRKVTAVSRGAYEAALAVGGSLLLAGLAQFSVKLPFTPVPITGQTLGVLLIGAAFGPALGAATILLYLLEGAVGLPFYARGGHGWAALSLSSSLGATGGYLWGFAVAAGVVGWLSRSGWDRSMRSSIGAMFIGEVIMYGFGVPWLMVVAHLKLADGLALGLYPFVIGDAIKLLLAAGALPLAWRLTEGRGARSR